MGLPQLPDVRGEGVPAWAHTFLVVARRIFLALAHGVPDPMGRAVTFNDLVGLGLASKAAAEKQAREGR